MLRVEDASAAVAWYRRLGFTTEWVHRLEPDFPAFVSIVLDGPGTRLFLSEHRGDAPGPAFVWLRVPDIGGIAAEFALEPRRFGRRVEVALIDPDGNRITVGAAGDAEQRPSDEYRYTLGSAAVGASRSTVTRASSGAAYASQTSASLPRTRRERPFAQPLATSK